MGACRAFIAAWCAISRLPRLPRAPAPIRVTSIPAFLCSLLLQCRDTLRPRLQRRIHKEIEKLKTTDVSDAELAMYKTRARADLLRGLANNQGLANALAQYQTRYGDWRELFGQLDRVDKVTKADIRRVANQVFVASNRTTGQLDTEAPAASAKKDGSAQ